MLHRNRIATFTSSLLSVLKTIVPNASAVAEMGKVVVVEVEVEEAEEVEEVVEGGAAEVAAAKEAGVARWFFKYHSCEYNIHVPHVVHT